MVTVQFMGRGQTIAYWWHQIDDLIRQFPKINEYQTQRERLKEINAVIKHYFELDPDHHKIDFDETKKVILELPAPEFQKG